jgi:hypothetical protein
MSREQAEEDEMEDEESADVIPEVTHPRSDEWQSPKSISQILGGIDAKCGFKLPER